MKTNWLGQTIPPLSATGSLAPIDPGFEPGQQVPSAVLRGTFFLTERTKKAYFRRQNPESSTFCNAGEHFLGGKGGQGVGTAQGGNSF